MNVTHTGGNYMSDGMGIAASTDLVWDENGNNQAYVLQQMQNYLGIHTYHVTIDPQGEYIKHIDCWAKFLDVDKILIAQVPPSNPRYWAYEQVANYYAEQISSYGTPFR
jgi:agmatine deiminase